MANIRKKRVLKSERSSRRLRSSESKSSKKTTKTDLSLKRSSKKTILTKKQKLAKNDTRKQLEEPFIKEKKSTRKYQRRRLSYTENIPLDDLSLTTNYPRRQVKSNGYKRSSKIFFRRKSSASETVKETDKDYEDDIFEGQEERFQKFKNLLEDISDDSESSFSKMPTPKLPFTPVMRQKTPKRRFPLKFCSPAQYAASRRAALEYMYIRQKRREAYEMISESPVISESKKPEYSQALENTQKLQANAENLAREDSVNDSYFSID